MGHKAKLAQPGAAARVCAPTRGGVSTTDWAEQFFPTGTRFGAGPSPPNWSKYTDTKECQTWVDAYNVTQADSGDITGTDSRMTSVMSVNPQAVTVGNPYSLQVAAETTGSDNAKITATDFGP